MKVKPGVDREGGDVVPQTLKETIVTGIAIVVLILLAVLCIVSFIGGLHEIYTWLL